MIHFTDFLKDNCNFKSSVTSHFNIVATKRFDCLNNCELSKSIKPILFGLKYFEYKDTNKCGWQVFVKCPVCGEIYKLKFSIPADFSSKMGDQLKDVDQLGNHPSLSECFGIVIQNSILTDKIKWKKSID